MDTKLNLNLITDNDHVMQHMQNLRCWVVSSTIDVQNQDISLSSNHNLN